ncbi:hypothetical protein SLA2020_068250 [Shorea laevis]
MLRRTASLPYASCRRLHSILINLLLSSFFPKPSNYIGKSPRIAKPTPRSVIVPLNWALDRGAQMEEVSCPQTLWWDNHREERYQCCEL